MQRSVDRGNNLRRSLSVHLLALCLLGPSLFLPMAFGQDEASTTGRQSPIPFTIKFPETGGKNSTFTFKSPPKGVVTKAALELTTQEVTYPSSKRYYKYGDAGLDHKAYKGLLDSAAPTKGPTTYKSTSATASDLTNMTSKDLKYFEATATPSTGPDYAYQHFIFDIHNGRNYLEKVDYYWEGTGLLQKTVGYSCGATLFIWDLNQLAWSQLKTAKDTFCTAANPTKLMFSGTYTMNYKVGDDSPIPTIDLLVQNPLENSANHVTMATDVMRINVTSHLESYPHFLGVNVGDDSSIEHIYRDQVKGSYLFGDDHGFKSALQSLINTSDKVIGSDGKFEVPIAFNSSTGGLLTVKTLDFYVDTPPTRAKLIENPSIKEDTPTIGLVDLQEYFSDDMGVSNLSFSIPNNITSSNIKVEISKSRYLSVISVTPNWTGNMKLMIIAKDLWGQQMPSNDFLINVEPVNDPPVLDTIKPPKAYEDRPFSYNVTARDIDGDSLTFTDDSPLFDIETKTGAISFTPIQDNIGRNLFNITVLDNNGSEAKQSAELEIIATNDRPTVSLLLPTHDFQVTEDKVKLAWVGKDIDFDDLTYTLYIDRGSGLVVAAKGLEISEYGMTGLVSGSTIKWTVEATDGQLTSVRPPTFTFTVKYSTGGGGGGGGGGNNNTTVNQPPTVTLLSPGKGSTLGTLSPTFTWSGYDPDLDKLTYKVIIYSTANLELSRNITNVPYFTLQTTLDNDQKYYWTVIPNDGTVDGVCLSGQWSFSIKRNGTIEPKPPTATVIVTPTGPIDEGGSVSFDASGSSDTDGSIVLFIWTFGDGITLTGPGYMKVDHTFKTGGNYNVSLVVFDNDGKTDIWNNQVVVKAKPVVKPQVKIFGLTQTQLLILLIVLVAAVSLGTAFAFIAYRRIKYERYDVDQVFFIFHDGRLIKHASKKPPSEGDSEKEVFGGMLTAVQDFVKDSLTDKTGKSSLKILEFGDQKIVIERGSKTFLAAFITGNATEALRKRMRGIVDNIENSQRDLLVSWDGDQNSIKGAETALAELIKK